MLRNSMLEAVVSMVVAYWAAFKDELTTHWAWGAGQALGADAFAESGKRELTAAQVATVITVVTVGLVAIIGILIFDEVDTSIGAPSNTALSNSQSNVTDGFGDAMDLVPIVLLVLIASLVIAVVQQF